MSVLWSGFLEVFQVSLFWLTQSYGGHLASAIISFSLLARLLLLPLTVRLFLRTREHARRTRALRPELERVRRKWGSEDPGRVASERTFIPDLPTGVPLGQRSGPHGGPGITRVWG